MATNFIRTHKMSITTCHVTSAMSVADLKGHNTKAGLPMARIKWLESTAGEKFGKK